MSANIFKRISIEYIQYYIQIHLACPTSSRKQGFHQMLG